MTSQTLIRLKLVAALIALGCGIGAVVTVYLLYQATPAATSTPPSPQAAPAQPRVQAIAASFPSPPSDALVLAREDRDLAVGLAVTRRSDRVALQASVLGSDRPVSGLAVSFGKGDANRLPATTCGAGCYAGWVPLGTRTVGIMIRGPNRAASAVSFPLPASVPGPPAAALVRQAETTWRRLRTLVVHDRLSSGPGATLDTLWRFVAPDRYTYAIRTGPAAVSIGPRRWDRLPGQHWQESEQDPIRQPLPLWRSVSNAHVLGISTLRGRRVIRASFFDPQLPAWFTITVDPATMRTLDLRMTAKAHFMHEVYGPFDAPLRIVPPAKAAS
jgi:hypothetical protein